MTTTRPPVPPRLAYPPAEVAELLGLGRSKVMVMIADGEIPSVKIGRARRVLHSDLVEYLERLQGGRDAS